MILPADLHFATSSRSSIEVAGAIVEDTVWDADTVLVTGNVEIAHGVTLSIPPATRVEFQGWYLLAIKGRLLAVGAPDAWIRFTSREPELFHPDTSLAGSWHGIRWEGTLSTNADSRLQFCLLEYAKEVDSLQTGGAVFASEFSRLTIVDCIFRHNLAWHGAAIACERNASPVITGNLIIRNTSLAGGSALFCSYANPRLTGNTIVLNEILNEEIFYATGTVHTFIAKPWIAANIIRNNTCHYFIPGELLEAKDYYTTCNNLTDGHGGIGNIDLDPLFSEHPDHPFSLTEHSPCVDVLDTEAGVLPFPEQDLLGNLRVWDGDGNGEAWVDMGAYEFGAPPCERSCPVPAPVPSGLRLVRNYPNPFNAETTIEFELGMPGEVNLRVYDLLGRRVNDFTLGFREAGLHRQVWRAGSLASGIYFLELRQGTLLRQVKVMLLK